MQAHCGILRERVLRAAAACFGHRLMMDMIVPGGVARDLAEPSGAAAIRDLVAELRESSRGWSSSTTTPPRCRTAPSPPASSNRTMRASSAPAAMSAAPRVATSMRGARPATRPTMHCRSRCRCSKPATSMRGSGSASARSSRAWRWSTRSSTGLPQGDVRTDHRCARSGRRRHGLCRRLPRRHPGLAAARRRRPHRALPPARPSWFQWPLLEAAIEGNIVADFPLCNKSFNCSYSGHDL